MICDMTEFLLLQLAAQTRFGSITVVQVRTKAELSAFSATTAPWKSMELCGSPGSRPKVAHFKSERKPNSRLSLPLLSHASVRQ
jgi:hypothetical protein